MKIFKDTEVTPKQKKLETFLNRFFLKEFGADPGIKLKEFDITTAKQDAERHQIYTQNGIMTVDEVRDELGLQPLDQQADQQDTKKGLLTSLETIRKHYESNV